MDKSVFAGNIAYSLTRGGWSAGLIEAILLKRFPHVLHKHVPAISLELIQIFPTPYSPAPEVVVGELLYSETFHSVWVFCRKNGIYPEADLTPPAMAPIPVFEKLDLPQLPTVERVADWLLLPVARLLYLADQTSRFEEHEKVQINHYHYTLQEKKSGGVRLIESPKPLLKSVQRFILQHILDKVPNDEAAYGFVKGRNCLDSASRHAGEETVVCFDLKDFFPSISSARVFGLFRCLGYPINVARILTSLCSSKTPRHVLKRMSIADRDLYGKPHLPQGAPTSPALANHIAFRLDRRLSALASRLGANYTRYADDLSFSGGKQIASTLLRAVPEIVQNEGFVSNMKKTRVMPNSSRQMVTGIIVNQHVNTSRNSFDLLKAEIHAIGKIGDERLSDPKFRAALIGRIGWVESVNPNRGRKLRLLLEKSWTKKQLSHASQ